MSVPGIQMMMPGGLGHQEWPHRGSSSLDLSLKKKGKGEMEGERVWGRRA